MLENFQPDLIAVDGNSLLHRAFYALPDMRSKEGIPTGALYGFLSMLIPLMETEPEYFLVAFDRHGPTFRHEEYKEYKAGRKETPPDLREQFPILKEILKELGVFTFELDRYEADDILGTVSSRFEQKNKKTLIVSGDRDGFQLVSDKVHLLLTKKGISESVEYTPALLMETYGLVPERMKDLKALMGDASDHIPGIAGVGEKTALQLLHDYQSLDGIIENADKLKGKLKEKVISGIEDAKLSYYLGTINRDIPAEITDDQLRFHIENLSNAVPLLKKLGMNNIVSRIASSSSKEETADDSRTVAVSTEEELRKIIKEAEEKGRISFLLQPEFSFSLDHSTSYLISKGETLFDEGLTFKDAILLLKVLFENPEIEKVTYDFKNSLHLFDALDISIRGRIHDCMLAEYIINATDKSGNLSDLNLKYNNCDHAYASYLYRIEEYQKQNMNESGLIRLYEDIELPFLYVLYEMEKTGFQVDIGTLKTLGNQYKSELENLKDEIYVIAGCEFNILSPKQLGELLFEKMKLPYSKKTKTGYATDADTLLKLKSESSIIEPILKYRFLNKLNSTYIDGLEKTVDPKDNRIHTKFNQCATATGRISSSEPNLQNIPVRSEEGKEIRKAFVAREGYVLIDGDYSQIELRILAHLSGDSKMIEAFKSGLDIHRKTASEVFKVPFEDVTGKMRSAAKAVNFGIVYGISDFGLSSNLNVSLKEAKEYIDSYLNNYTGIQEYMKRCVDEAKSKGYAMTMFGRRRQIPELHSNNYNVRSFGERVAMNMPVQGTAADIIKIAMCNVCKSLKEKKLRTKLILQVHDELILEAPEEETTVALNILKECMENAAVLDVPLTVDIQTGKSWDDAK